MLTGQQSQLGSPTTKRPRWDNGVTRWGNVHSSEGADAGGNAGDNARGNAGDNAGGNAGARALATLATLVTTLPEERAGGGVEVEPPEGQQPPGYTTAS